MLQLIILLAFSAALQSQAAAPAAAEFTGQVIDRAGGGIPGVKVTLSAVSAASSNAASEPRIAFTGGTGVYRLSDVAPGTYAVTFELVGFVTYSRARVAIPSGKTQALPVALEVGPMKTNDRVEGIPPPPEPRFGLTQGEVAVCVDTSMGTFYIAVDTRRAPLTATNFLRYVDATLYDWGRFHRATRPDNYTSAPPNRPMMNIIQGGINPAKRSEGFPAIPLERTSMTGIKHVTGVVSMARGAADSATSDFFVLLDDQPSLDFGGLRFDDGQGGAAFGRVLAGLDVVRKIQQQPVDGQNLAAPVTIRRVWRLR